jgi:glyoxylase-like metal-dependent hydrolase (beta-lactamase superfamily II)
VVATCFVCRTCGVQHAAAERPPDQCVICTDERQYVGWDGQAWATLDELRAEGVRCELRDLEPGLVGIGTSPPVGIGQRALLVATPAGNLLWDCVGYLDAAAAGRVADLGGIAAIACSHPHFYGAMVEWSAAFGGAPVYVPRADRAWLVRPDPAVRLWEGRADPLPGVTLVQCGGHFEGSSVLHWPAGAGGGGVLLVGDTITVVADRRYVSFMRSYPNLIPLPAPAVRRVVAAVSGLRFDRIYGGWWDRDLREGAHRAVTRSAARYLAHLEREDG